VKRGFYDGDYPNAHQSLKTEHTHNFAAEDTDKKHFKDTHKHLTGLGFTHNHHKYKSSRGGIKDYHTYSKGSHYITLEHLPMTKGSKKKKLTVKHKYETSKPDTDFERSGRGIGQII